MSRLRKLILTIVAIGGLGSVTVATADAPKASSPKSDKCTGSDCNSFCWSEPGCEAYMQCERLLIVPCTASNEFGTC